MCKCLGIARSSYYYRPAGTAEAANLEDLVEMIFNQNRKVYGSRKIKAILAKRGTILSRRRINRIMKKRNLYSAYSISRFKPGKFKVNESAVPNLLNRQFDRQPEYAAVVSDLTYVRVNYKWNYVCLLLDLFNREIIGYSAGTRKNAELVFDAFARVRTDLRNIRMLHTDRGGEFNNLLIDEVLDTFEISRSLSLKGCPYDNAVAESTFRIFKAEFVSRRNFDSLDRLSVELADYVHWFNHHRIHSSLGYLSPVEYKAMHL